MGGREILCARVVGIDSEFDAKKGQGERPGPPICICAIEVDQNGREIEHRLAAPYPPRPPWDRGDPFLTVGFALSAEAGSFLHVSWPFPMPAIDLYAEYMALHNTEMSRGDDSKGPGPTLIQACQRYGVTAMSVVRKEEMRTLAYTKSDHSPEEIALMQDYCLDEDCRMVLRLLRAMLPRIDLLRAPIRGAFMMEIERVRWRGLPIDTPKYQRAVQRAPSIATGLRDELNRKLGTEIYCDGIYKRGAVLNLTAWLERILVKAAHCVPITCVLGWSLSATGRFGEERTFMNFPMQANAAEMMRLVFIRCSHLPLIWCAHDSFLVEAPASQIEQVAAEVQAIMRGVSRDLLGGFELRADCNPAKDIVRYPDRFIDKRDREDGMRRWRRLMELVEEEDNGDERTTHSALGDATACCCDEKEKEAETPGVQDRVGSTTGSMANPVTENEQRERNKSGDYGPVRGAPG